VILPLSPCLGLDRAGYSFSGWKAVKYYIIIITFLPGLESRKSHSILKFNFQNLITFPHIWYYIYQSIVWKRYYIICVDCKILFCIQRKIIVIRCVLGSVAVCCILCFVNLVVRFKSVGKLSGGHQAAVMALAIDDTDTADGSICLVTGSKDHYIKVCPLFISFI